MTQANTKPKPTNPVLDLNEIVNAPNGPFRTKDEELGIERDLTVFDVVYPCALNYTCRDKRTELEIAREERLSSVIAELIYQEKNTGKIELPVARMKLLRKAVAFYPGYAGAIKNIVRDRINGILGEED